MLLELLKEVYPEGETLPTTYYEAKKVIRELGLGYDKIHASDSEVWKDFDLEYMSFAMDGRNVRLGITSDGFNPFGNMSNSYSMWPVFVVPYNLPPWKCIKDPFFMMSLLIPGPTAP
ncbi:hypothetical protein Ddye_009927 [Dipteronia dyeriana]|uniref:Uncharacterized protein n=1 Tax=Dipteronia dyeriana TaxID=168575 RepID=A0AAE0CMN6_9ROSI|nr:hypothetical protein Ddye_009927 [Dipteronia dyeriana]